MGTDDARPTDAPSRTIVISRGFWIGDYEQTQREAALIWLKGTAAADQCP